MPIRQFVQRIQQLNSYLDLLPCLFYSKHATKLTKVVQSFNDADLASHILRMVPRNWQDQYGLTGGTVPQSVRKLLEVLERIEKAFPTEKDHEKPKAGAPGGGSSKKKMVSFDDQIPKKSRKNAKALHTMQEVWEHAEHPQHGQLQEVQLGWYSKKGLRREEHSAQPAERKLAARQGN